MAPRFWRTSTREPSTVARALPNLPATELCPVASHSHKEPWSSPAIAWRCTVQVAATTSSRRSGARTLRGPSLLGGFGRGFAKSEWSRTEMSAVASVKPERMKADPSARTLEPCGTSEQRATVEFQTPQIADVGMLYRAAEILDAASRGGKCESIAINVCRPFWKY